MKWVHNNNLRVMAALFPWNTAQCIVIEEDLFLLAPRSHGSLKAQLTYNVIIGYDYSESHMVKGLLDVIVTSVNVSLNFLVKN